LSGTIGVAARPYSMPKTTRHPKAAEASVTDGVEELAQRSLKTAGIPKARGMIMLT